MKDKKFYCHGEGSEFPEHEFYHDENGALIHNIGKGHYAATGDPVIPGEIPEAEEE